MNTRLIKARLTEMEAGGQVEIKMLTTSARAVLVAAD